MAELWKTILDNLEGSVSRPNFVTWLKPCKMEGGNGLYTIIAPNHYAKSWLEKNALDKIRELVQVKDGGEVEVNITIGHSKQTQPLDELPLLSTPEPDEDTPKKTKAEEVAENPLNPHYTFDTFIVGSNNRLAFAASQVVADKPGHSYNPLFLYGGVGLGKTHLMQAIGNEIYKRDPRKKIIFTSCETFTSEFINALQNKTINDFKKKYRTVDVFLIDDIQFLANKEGTQEEFFHTFNMLHQSNRQIVITSDRMPRDMTNLEDRLTSRFGWGMIADIQTPNFETRVAILQTKAEEKNLSIPKDVIEYIANTVTSNVRELEGSLTKLAAAAIVEDVPVTRDFATRILKDIMRSTKVGATGRQVINAVSKHFNLEVGDILSTKRNKDLVYARQVIMYFLREILHQSYPQIGESLGGKDHTTIMHGVNKICDLRKKDSQVESDINSILEKLNQ